MESVIFNVSEIYKVDFSEVTQTLSTLVYSVNKEQTYVTWITLEVPSNYNYVMRRKNFIWIKKEISSGNMSLLIYKLPLSAISKYNEINNITRKRDSIGNLYIHGKESRSKMITEVAYSPYFSIINLE